MKKEKTFFVPVVRTGYGFATIEVKAKDQKEANEKALDQAGDHEYSEKTADYTLENATDQKKKIVVYVSTDEDTTIKLDETSKAPLSKLQKHEFNNMAEVDAFYEGVKIADSLDSCMIVLKYEIKGRTLHLKHK